MEDITSIVFLLGALFFLVLERFSGIRRPLASIRYRWLTNLGLLIGGLLLTSVLFSDSITVVAAGLPDGFVSSLGMPLWLEAVLLLLFLDCWAYWEHRVFHEVPLMWRAHLVHHSDTAVDITTAVRHHPFEKVVGMILLLLLVFALGFSAQALGVYLLVVSVSALMTHASITLPESLDARLRFWLVTPAVHGVHHSSKPAETNSNYGSVFTVWDRLFGTYCSPAAGSVNFGLEYFRGEQHSTLLAALMQPLHYSLDGRESEKSGHILPIVQNRPGSLAWRQTLLYGAVGFVLTILVFWPTVLDLAKLWTNAEPYRYGWLVFPVFVYTVAWHRRDSILTLTPSAGYYGLPIILLATLLWLMSRSADIMLGQHLALVFMLQGVAVSALGKNTYLKLLPIMLLLFFMVPNGDVFQLPLRDLTLKWLDWFSTLVGLPHSIDEYRIVIGEKKYIVLPECSGLSLFNLAAFLGYSFGLLLFHSTGKVLALAALGAAFGVLANAVRVCLIVAIDWNNGTQMNLAAHKEIQWLLLVVLIGGLLYLTSRLKQEDWPFTEAQTPEL